jgi:hypothetical protein
VAQNDDKQFGSRFRPLTGPVRLFHEGLLLSLALLGAGWSLELNHYLGMSIFKEQFLGVISPSAWWRCLSRCRPGQLIPSPALPRSAPPTWSQYPHRNLNIAKALANVHFPPILGVHSFRAKPNFNCSDHA